MRVFGTVVQPLVPMMRHAREHLAHGSAVAGELTGDEQRAARRPVPSAVPVRSARRPYRAGVVQDLAHVAVLVDGTPARVPLPDSFVGQHNAPLGKQLLHIAIAQRKPALQPDGVANDLRRKAVTGV